MWEKYFYIFLRAGIEAVCPAAEPAGYLACGLLPACAGRKVSSDSWKQVSPAHQLLKRLVKVEITEGTPLVSIDIDESSVIIDADGVAAITPTDRAGKTLRDARPVISLRGRAPELKVYLGGDLVVRYRIDATRECPDLDGTYLHASIRILDNLALMIDGTISADPTDQKGGAARQSSGEPYSEGIRFQPRYIGSAAPRNQQFVGKGLFERGLHYAGLVTPGNVRACCVCDACGERFSLEHVHTGFGQDWGAGQYFYCEKGTHTLLVDTDKVPECPVALQEDVNPELLKKIEAALPPCGVCGSAFRYYNSLRCPNCSAAFVDFERYPAMRPGEYYGCCLLEEIWQHFSP